MFFLFVPDFSIAAITDPVYLAMPDVAGNSVTGTYLVVWESRDSVGELNIYEQRYDNGEYYAVYQPLILR